MWLLARHTEIESLKTKQQANIPRAYNSHTAWQDLVLQFSLTNRYMAFICALRPWFYWKHILHSCTLSLSLNLSLCLSPHLSLCNPHPSFSVFCLFCSHFCLPLPAQYGHGLSIILAAQQLVDVGVQHGECQLKDDLDAVEEEAVHHHHCALKRHDRQEEGEEPGERDSGDDPKVLHAVVQLRNVLAGELLEHPLID